MLGGDTTQTGTSWRPKLLAIERPFRFPPTTNAPVVLFMIGISFESLSPHGSHLKCANHAGAIIPAQRRVVRRLERDCLPPCGRRIASECVKNSACLRRTASTDRNSKQRALPECAIPGRMFRTHQ